LGSIRSMSISCGPADMFSRLGGATAPIAAVVGGAVGEEAPGCSTSPMSAPSPRPSAFLGISDDLLGELYIAFRPLAVYVIQNNRLTEARRFREPYIARNDALENLRPEEAPQVGRDLPR